MDLPRIRRGGGLRGAHRPLPQTLSLVGGCVKASPAVVAAIRAHPSGYYVNVHNRQYPDGAIRGQLS